MRLGGSRFGFSENEKLNKMCKTAVLTSNLCSILCFSRWCLLCGKLGLDLLNASRRSTGAISMFTARCFPWYSISTIEPQIWTLWCSRNRIGAPGRVAHLCAAEAAHCSTADPRWESHRQDQEMSQIVAHGPAAVFQDCHPGADALRRQCAGHVGRCAGNGRGFQSSVAHVAPDFAGSPAASIAASSFCQDGTAHAHGRLWRSPVQGTISIQQGRVLRHPVQHVGLGRRQARWWCWLARHDSPNRTQAPRLYLVLVWLGFDDSLAPSFEMVCIVRLADSAWRIALDHFQNFMFILTTVNQRYGKLISDVKVWSEYFPAFADHLGSMGFQFKTVLWWLTARWRKLPGQEVSDVVGAKVCVRILVLVSRLIVNSSITHTHTHRRWMRLCQYERPPSLPRQRSKAWLLCDLLSFKSFYGPSY